MEPKVIVITGPTCSGKTKLGLILARKLNTEIISADSRQIYKYLDIGTAKPSPHERELIPHHFIDSLEPDETYNSGRFEIDALKVIKALIDKNKIPVVVGGSGLYVKALVDGIFDLAGTDEEYREYLLGLKKEYGNEYIYGELKKVDPESSLKMLPQNWKRVMRALEVFHVTGKKIGELHAEYKRKINYKFVQYGLSWNRATLYMNIERRADKMMEDGLVGETERVLSMGFKKDLNSLNTVGYKEIISCLENEISPDRATELIKRNTRRFAKRQMTWFGADKRIRWFDIGNYGGKSGGEVNFGEIAEEIIRREGINER